MAKRLIGLFISLLLGAPLWAQVRLPAQKVHSDGASWHLKGQGFVCCPCAVPCPCRSNAPPTYGHCEATLYAEIHQGHYGTTRLDGVKLIQVGGDCSMSSHQLSAIYVDPSATPEQRGALMQLIASFRKDQTVSFPYVLAVPIDTQVTGGHLFHITIPGILEMLIDKYWGQASPPFTPVAAQDNFANELLYVQNLRYKVTDDAAHLHFDYSRRQANYRVIDLDGSQYVSHTMLIQFTDGKGWFSADQLRLIQEQHLPTPDLAGVRKQVHSILHRGGGAGAAR
ncbi:MAG: DUF1326 domain-containing protein [Candidatus Dormibacteraceae bacterium]